MQIAPRRDSGQQKSLTLLVISITYAIATSSGYAQGVVAIPRALLRRCAKACIMCNRIVQKAPIADYLHLIWPEVDVSPDVAAAIQDVTAESAVLAFHQPQPDVKRLSRFLWGHRTQTATRPIINARSEAIIWEESPWRPLMRLGRALVPADGWYEYAALKRGSKNTTRQAYIAHAEMGAPLLLAALTTWRASASENTPHTLVLLTRDAPLERSVALNPRQPLAIPPMVARAWLEPDTPMHLLFDILAVALPDTSFQLDRAADSYELAESALPHPRDAL